VYKEGFERLRTLKPEIEHVRKVRNRAVKSTMYCQNKIEQDRKKCNLFLRKKISIFCLLSEFLICFYNRSFF
jgi:hypothetical protein